MRTQSQERYLVDKKGRPKAVVLGMAQYRKMLSAIEDLEDALDLKRARATASHFLSHEELLKRLRIHGRA